MMNPDRWQQASRILAIALERQPERRAAYLDEVCANDAALRQEVESLLVASAQAGSLLDSAAMAMAAPLFIDDSEKTVLGQSIGRYKIVTTLGTGGMGEVYLAHDTRLGRKIALKLLPNQFTTDKDRLRRFEQEAHAASTLSHPNICMIHEVGESEDARHFIAMEYVDGVTLRQHMTEARMKLSEVLDVSVQVASGLAASHEVGVVHRDIKPENIMLRHDGYVKVLDFGLAKLTEQPTSDVTIPAGTRVSTDIGVVMGTSRYMSPEQTRGLTVDARTDIWSLGVVVYEMVTGGVPFEGATKSDVIASVLGREPSLMIVHAPEVPAELQRIVSKALRKEREERYETVKDMAFDLKSLKQELEFEARLGSSGRLDAGREGSSGGSGRLAVVETKHGAAVRAGAARPITRLMVMPFRMLRADPDLDFLAFSVPNAVAGALSVLDSVVVRSPTGAARYTGEFLDLKEIAEEAQAQAVLTGTILRSGNGIGMNCQLLELPNGTVLWSHQPHLSMSDLFELQESLVRGIVESLSLSLSRDEHRLLKRDVPANSMAYEFYLRGNELSRRGLAGFGDLTVARDLYLRGVEMDPHYAPAWAQLGRCYRLIGKGMENGHENLLLAESSFKLALELNPDLPQAHAQYAVLEAELGRAKDAIKRLLQCAQSGNASPDLFAALVLCCRFCGLLEASVAAHERAHQLDPQIATSVSHTHYQLGDYESALRDAAVGAWGIVGVTLATMGRKIEGLAAYSKLEQSGLPVPMREFTVAWRAMLEGNGKESLDAADQSIQHYLDPEGLFYMGLLMAHLGESERALKVLRECMDRGFFSVRALRRNPWFDGLRSTAQFNDLLKRGDACIIEADEVYRSSDGPQVLGA